MPTAKDCHTLTSYYIKRFKEVHAPVEPVVNRHSARWGFDSLLMDMSVQECKDLIDYYLGTSAVITQHKLPWLFSNYDKLLETRTEQQKDSEQRSKLRAESEQRAKEWREKLDAKQRSTNT